MYKTIKEFLADNTVKNIDEVIEGFYQGSTRKGFASYERIPMKEALNDGLISIEDFFNGDSAGDPVIIEDFKETLQEEGVSLTDYTFLNDGYTYNYSGSLERDMRFINFINNEHGFGDVITFYSIHTGLDARAGFSEWFPVSYFDDYHHSEHLLESFNLRYIKAKDSEGLTYGITINGSAASEEKNFYIHETTNKNLLDESNFCYMDTSYIPGLKEDLKDLFKEDYTIELTDIEVIE